MKQVSIDIVPLLYEVAMGQVRTNDDLLAHNNIIDKGNATKIFLSRYENGPIFIREARRVRINGKVFFTKEKRLPILIMKVMEQYNVSRSIARQAILNLKLELMNT